MTPYELIMLGQLDVECVADTNTHTDGDAAYGGIFVVEASAITTIGLGRGATGSMNGWTLPAGFWLRTRIESLKLASGKAILIKGAGRP